MKLLTRSNLNSSLLLLAALATGALVVYWQLSEEIREEIDEDLLNRKLEILASLPAQTDSLLTQTGLRPDFELQEISPEAYRSLHEHFYEEELYELYEEEKEPHRVLTTGFEHKGHFYQLRIHTSLLDLEDMAEIIFWGTGWLFLFVLGIGFLLNRYMQRRLWRPFYKTLEELRRFQLDASEMPPLPSSTIHEFHELNQAIERLLERNRQAYLKQKQFTENAAHELQTPLAVALSQAELLLQSPALQANDMLALEELYQQLERLTALNKALLMITKISNQQYDRSTALNISPLAAELVAEYAQLANHKALELDSHIEPGVTVYIHPHLVEVLLRNLLRNAMTHSPEGGTITITLTARYLQIDNPMRTPFPGDPAQLFERFTKHGDHRQSLGLGLAIVQSICETHGFRPAISIQGTRFSIKVQF
ncbi:MAG: HAMP domain-containing histidine kinase [Bacteroidetes bacterium]|nr:HAMP domain-containing histidine kinase [Bacteroidota bacterium]